MCDCQSNPNFDSYLGGTVASWLANWTVVHIQVLVKVSALCLLDTLKLCSLKPGVKMGEFDAGVNSAKAHFQTEWKSGAGGDLC